MWTNNSSTRLLVNFLHALAARRDVNRGGLLVNIFQKRQKQNVNFVNRKLRGVPAALFLVSLYIFKN